MRRARANVTRHERTSLLFDLATLAAYYEYSNASIFTRNSMRLAHLQAHFDEDPHQRRRRRRRRRRASSRSADTNKDIFDFAFVTDDDKEARAEALAARAAQIHYRVCACS